jgi:hypothetical protein
MTSRTVLAASLLVASFVGVAAVQASCVSQESSCGAPSAPTYDCSPIDPDGGVPGCLGGPHPSFKQVPDDGKLFPNGCRSEIPACSPLVQGKPEACRCEPDVLLDGGLAWICPVM